MLRIIGTIHLPAIVIALLTAVLLTACGGGGKKSMTADTITTPTPPPAAPVEIDTLIFSDIETQTNRGKIRIQTDCEGATCTLRLFGVEETISISGVFGSDTDFEELVPTETYRGVSLSKETGSELEYDFGWFKYSLFAAGLYKFPQLSVAGAPFSMSIGDATGTNPASITESATWSGVMLGRDMDPASGFARIRGNADITIADFMNPRVNVDFTRIKDLNTNRSRDNMNWSGIPLHGGGFKTGSDGNSIQGKFYGPNHEEIGGIFERDRVIGAFGTKRSP